MRLNPEVIKLRAGAILGSEAEAALRWHLAIQLHAMQLPSA